MKIIAQVNPRSGSDFHRKKVPLQYLKADFAEELTTELVKNYDILWINRNCKISAASLSIWKQLGLKIVFDLDDSLVIPPNYPNVKNHVLANENVKDKLFLADWVTVSTQELVKEVLPLNPNVTVIPNRLDFKNLPIKEETLDQFLNRKIRVGFIGAFTHYEDWKSIKGWMNTLITHPKFKEDCEFVMIGYDKSVHKYWQEFANLGKFAVAKLPDEYITLFHEIDIILCPLVDNQLNRAKSSLRILESGVGDCVCLVDPLYNLKSDLDFKSYFTVKKPKEWVSKTLELVQDKKLLFNIKKEFGETIRKNKFKPVVDLRKEICQRVLTLPKEESKYNLYSIKYKDDQLTEYTPIYNRVSSIEEKSYLFEYNVMLDIIPKINNNDFTGMFSWKFPIKTKLFKKKINKILDDNQKYDCIIFSKPLEEKYLKFTERVHPGFIELFVKICNDLDLPVNEPKYTIYSNFFVMKGELYKEYVETVIKPAIDLLETKYKDLAWRNAKYTSGLSKEDLKEHTGLDYYTFHTFILERLVGQWIDKKGLKVFNYWR